MGKHPRGVTGPSRCPLRGSAFLYGAGRSPASRKEALEWEKKVTRRRNEAREGKRRKAHRLKRGMYLLREKRSPLKGRIKASKKEDERKEKIYRMVEDQESRIPKKVSFLAPRARRQKVK